MMKLIALIIAVIFGLGAAERPPQLVYHSFVADPGKLTLVENYAAQLKSEQIVAKNKCVWGINGGFYDANFQPLGLVINGSTEKHPARLSALFNGFISNEGISRNTPINPVWAIQTGPILIESGTAIKLAMAADKPARRMVAATDMNGRMRLITLYWDSSRFDGPTLDELGQKLTEISNKEGWKIITAINLDGGSASAFFGPDLVLPELTPVGSWLCAK